MKEIITMEVIKITTMGSFDPLIQLVTPFAEDALLFFQTMAVLFATAMGVYYKLRQIFADAQEDQMWDKKTRGVFVGLVFIFAIPTVIKVLSSYFPASFMEISFTIFTFCWIGRCNTPTLSTLVFPSCHG